MCKMRKFELFRKVFVLCGVFFCFASCDTRDDYILEHCDEPVITLVNPEKWGSEEIFNQKYVAVDLCWGDSVELDFNFEDKYGISGDFSYEINGTLNSTALYEYYTDGSDEYDDVFKSVESVGNHLSVEMDSDNRKIIIKEKTKSAEYFYEKLAPYWTISVSNPIDMSSGGRALVSARITLKIKNKIGKEGLFYVYLQVWSRRDPVCAVRRPFQEKLRGWRELFPGKHKAWSFPPAANRPFPEVHTKTPPQQGQRSDRETGYPHTE